MKASQKAGWKRTHIANRLMVWTTAVVAFGTLFYAGAAIWQIHVLKLSAQQQAEQTNRLIAAAERAATIANTAADDAHRANEEMLNKAERLTHANEEIVKTATKQANASMSQASTAKRGTDIAEETLKTEWRPSLGVLVAIMKDAEVGKPAEVDVVFQNFGRSPAKNMTTITTTWWGTQVCIEPPQNSPILPGQIGSRGNLPMNVTRVSHGSTAIPLSQAVFDLVQADPPKIWAYVFSRAEYEDSRGGHYFTEFYGRYNFKLKVLQECPTHNDAN